jgi:hypothetical protein
MLTERQLLTIQHLKDIQGLTVPLDIIKYCIEQINKPHKGNFKNGKRQSRAETRKRSKQYYQEIINYLAQGNS